MQRYNIYVPKAKGAPQGITIADLIPVGRENAISRKMLVALCVDQGLVAPTIKDKDRAMRLLIQRDRIDYRSLTCLMEMVIIGRQRLISYICNSIYGRRKRGLRRCLKISNRPSGSMRTIRKAGFRNELFG
jgi:hypothetical protein